MLHTSLLWFHNGGIPTTLESQGFKQFAGNLREEGNCFQLTGNVTIKDSHQQLARVANQGLVNKKENYMWIWISIFDSPVPLSTWSRINHPVSNKMMKTWLGLINDLVWSEASTRGGWPQEDQQPKVFEVNTFCGWQLK